MDVSLLSRACDRFLAGADVARQSEAMIRFDRHGTQLLQRLSRLYGRQPGFEPWLLSLFTTLGTFARARSNELRELDRRREQNPDWFIDDKRVGYCAYVDRFGSDLNGVAERVGYLESLGIGYLHLLPFLRARSGDSDGGFAVASFDEVEPALGSMDDLERLAARLRKGRISLCADLVLNHVADQHEWAVAAMRGDQHYRAYFHLFPDRRLPDRYEQTVAQIFPQTAPGNFSYVDALQSWVWTTFYPYQWDLNYAHPPVFASIASALLQLANRGVEVFRLDSAPFLWKREGTSCMNQPEVHQILGALRAMIDLVAPGVLLKAEAIVASTELLPYLGVGEALGRECHLAYHSGLMAASWVALSEGRTELLQQLLDSTPALPAHTGWMTYVRCHDDIVWGVLRSDVETAGTDFIQRIGAAAAFLEGRRPGSFGHGTAFQSAGSNAVHGTNGMTSALVGLDSVAGDDALRRLALMYGLAFVAGTVPLLYMGDELAQSGNEAEQDAALIALDGRWLQRPRLDLARLKQQSDADTLAGKAHAVIKALIAARRDPAFAARAAAKTLASDNDAVLAIRRGERLVAAFNFSGRPQHVDWNRLNAGDGWTTLLQTADDASTGVELLPAWAMVWRKKT
ncbi:alpha-amylase family glycosyl hydrolase [Dyella flagellata]|uniref:Amylosucrase n=1 Tax=Dyella flagellata TaxID=1867833 RepID=A0ABQ5XDY1_9GAMM|nr:alpha-amylase family glycosyl hydrolase [Dyella flagellata]GLQ89431.1 amylosucrase [Dyella flagellata]